MTVDTKPFYFLDLNSYFGYVKSFATLSRLFSESNKPYIPYRFAEKLFCHCVKRPFSAIDLSRADNSFDSIISAGGYKAGVGVKTFVNSTTSYKDEKVAEFTKYAGTHNLGRYPIDELIYTIASLRNQRVLSDAAEYGIDIDKSFYHCLIRVENGFFIHEEPYPIVDINNIYPTDLSGNKIQTFTEPSGSMIPFSDGISFYKYNTAKNVLYKRFDFKVGKNTDIVHTIIDNDAFGRILSLIDKKAESHPMTLLNDSIIPDLSQAQLYNKPLIVLPLYSSKTDSDGKPIVAEKSGINQWNAGGRARSFGEAYIPIPSMLYKYFPDFFPFDEEGKPLPFTLKLPTEKIINVKICQSGNKALMSDPNTDLLQWLFATIDGSFDNSKSRLNTNDISQNKPYTYNDLIRINKDSVAIFKEGPFSFSIKTMPLNSFERFKSLIIDNGDKLQFEQLISDDES